MSSQGDPGEPGPPGEKGEAGDEVSTHVAPCTPLLTLRLGFCPKLMVLFILPHHREMQDQVAPPEIG